MVGIGGTGQLRSVGRRGPRYHVNQAPLLNGLFAVGKGEYVGPLATQRLIMNLIPSNRLCEPLVGRS